MFNDGSRALKFILSFSEAELVKRTNPILSKKWTSEFSLLTHFGFQQEQIKQFFEHFPEITSVRLLYNSDLDANDKSVFTEKTGSNQSIVTFMFYENVCN